MLECEPSTERNPQHRKKSLTGWRQPLVHGTESRRPWSGVAGARHDACEHENDATPLEIQVPTPDGHSSDDGHALAVPNTSDPPEVERSPAVEVAPRLFG